MTACVSCGSPLPDGSSFCSQCGRSQGESISQAQVAQQPLIRPEAQRAVAAATIAAQGIVATLGVDKLVLIAGGVLGAMGAVLPFVSFSTTQQSLQFQQFQNMLGTLSLIRLGAPGWGILLLAAALGIAPFVLHSTRMLAFAGITICVIVLANLLLDWTCIAVVQEVFVMLQTAATSVGSVFGGQSSSPSVAIGPGVGFFCSLVGFAMLTYSYVRSAAA